MLAATASGREVVSRRTGGDRRAFRIPDDARLLGPEVGTTNRTHAKDVAAVTALLMKSTPATTVLRVTKAVDGELVSLVANWMFQVVDRSGRQDSGRAPKSRCRRADRRR